jgi:hypothetical protein
MTRRKKQSTEELIERRLTAMSPVLKRMAKKRVKQEQSRELNKRVQDGINRLHWEAEESIREELRMEADSGASGSSSSASDSASASAS